MDDGSTDGSFRILAELHKADGRVKVIRFRKNFGQTAALSAGFAHAKGAIIIAIDADLQNDPADIPKMIEKLHEGYDVVSGWRKKRHDNAITRLIPSMAANWLISKITGVKLHDFGCTLKAYRREVLAETRLYGEMHRFIPALASWSGAHICEMVVNHRPRTAGVAKYGLGRTWKVMLDLITVKFLGSFSTKPIYIFGGLGLASGLGRRLSRTGRAVSEVPLGPGASDEQKSAADFDGGADYVNDTVYPDGPAGGAAGPDVSRVAEPADLRDSGNPRMN